MAEKVSFEDENSSIGEFQWIIQSTGVYIFPIRPFASFLTLTGSQAGLRTLFVVSDKVGKMWGRLRHKQSAPDSSRGPATFSSMNDPPSFYISSQAPDLPLRLAVPEHR
jgi:hypothetical protein